MTNYEKIKNMSVEEMAEKTAEFLENLCDKLECEDCPIMRQGMCAVDYDKRTIQWLNKEVSE